MPHDQEGILEKTEEHVMPDLNTYGYKSEKKITGALNTRL